MLLNLVLAFLFSTSSIMAELNISKTFEHFHIEHIDHHNSHDDQYALGADVSMPDTDSNHQHEHKHSPDGPLHNHNHDHNSGSQYQSDTKIFQSAGSFRFNEKAPLGDSFDKSDHLICQGYLLEIFRPPIA